MKFVTRVICFFFSLTLLSGCTTWQSSSESSRSDTSTAATTASTTATTIISEPENSVEPIHPDGSLLNPVTYRPQDRGENFIETEDYYFYLYEEFHKIYFSQKDNPEFFLLCSKPNCTHGDEDCNAFGRWALGYWENKLYTVFYYDADPYLIRMDMDGSNRETVAPIEIPIDSTGQGGGSYKGFFCDGYFYYDVEAQPDSFFRTELASGKTERLFQDLLADGSGIVRERFDGDCLYFTLQNPDGQRFLYRYPLAGGDAKMLCVFPGDKSLWTVENGIVYYYSKTDGTFYEYEVETETLTAKASVQLGPGAAYYDTEWIVLVTWPQEISGFECYIFDRSYKLLQHLPIPHSVEYLYAAGDKLFFSRLRSGKITDYILISDIGKEDAELHPVKDPYALR